MVIVGCVRGPASRPDKPRAVDNFVVAPVQWIELDPPLSLAAMSPEGVGCKWVRHHAPLVAPDSVTLPVVKCRDQPPCPPPPVPWCACASPDKLHADNTFQYSAPWPVALWSCAKQDPGQPVRVPLAVLGKLLQVARVPTAKDAKLRPAIEAPAFSEAEWQKMKVVAKLRFEGSQ